MEMPRSSPTLSEVWVRPFCVGALVMLVAAVSEMPAQQQVNFCSLFDPANDGRTITSTALMFHSTVGRVDGDDTFLYSAACNGPDYFAIPEGNAKVWGKWKRFFDALPSEKHLVLEIQFEGKPEVATAHLFGSLSGWARAQVTLSKIISIKDVTERPGTRANWDAPKPETDRIEAMRGLLDVFLTPLSAPIHGNHHLLDLMSEDFRFVDLSGKVFGKNQYASMNPRWFKRLQTSKSRAQDVN